VDLENALALLCAVGMVLNGIQVVDAWKRRMPWWMIVPWGINLAAMGAGLAWGDTVEAGGWDAERRAREARRGLQGSPRDDILGLRQFW
jgi:hypothetical protein